MAGGLGAVVADPVLSWARPDGWQCLAAPGWLYGEALLPPLEAVEDEIGGAALGIGVDSADHVQIGFRLDGVLRVIEFGYAWRERYEGWADRMVQDWGKAWRRGGADGLGRWAAGLDMESPSPMGVRGVLWARHKRPESFVFALLDVLGLGPEPSTPPWWVLAVPGAGYAVRARDLTLPVSLVPEADEASRDEVVLAFTDAGSGVYDLRTASWLVHPAPSYLAVLALLAEELERRGWTRDPHAPAFHPAGACAPPEATSQLPTHLAWPGRPPGPAPTKHAAGVTVAPDVYGPPSEFGWDGWDTDPCFLVRYDDVDGAASALERIQDRLMCVDDEGTELSTTELWGGWPNYTPNCVFEVERREDGAEIFVDTKGGLSGPMRRTMLRILTTELRTTGLTAHVARAGHDSSA